MLQYPSSPSVVGFMCYSGSPGCFSDEQSGGHLRNHGVVKMTDGEIEVVFQPPVRSQRRKEGVIKMAG